MTSCDNENDEIASCVDFEVNYNTDYPLETNWKLIGFEDKILSEEECIPSEYAFMGIVIDVDETFVASSSCNTIFGKYRITSDTGIVTDSIGMTKIYCDDPNNTYWENKFLNHLSNAESFRIDGNKLVLSSTEKVDMVFKAIN